MYNHPPNNFLYASYRISTVHSDGQKNLEGTATGFILEIGNKIPFIVTNRHVFDKNFGRKDNKYILFNLSKLTLTSRRQDDSEYTIDLNLRVC